MNKIESVLKGALQTAVKEAFNLYVDLSDIIIEMPKDKNHGDYATNLAMQLSKTLKNNPQIIAREIVEHLDFKSATLEKAEVAGPGFINLTIKSESLSSIIKQVLEEGDKFGSSDFGQGAKYNLEFVSANPTGNLHIGHARGAAIGDSVARIMKFAGYEVTTEYYINDAGNQINNVALSLRARYLQHFQVDCPLPEDGYPGGEIIEMAVELAEEVKDRYVEISLEESLPYFKAYALKIGIERIKKTLTRFGVNHDVWFSEQSLYDDKVIEPCLQRLADLGFTYQEENALWLNTMIFGDDQDRVLIKSDGTYTYLTPDIAYHLNKFERGYTRLVDFLGADHHGYIIRLKAAVAALGYNPNNLLIDIIQMVRIIKDGEVLLLSKRSGQAVSLDELIDDVGVEAVRYLFAAKASDTQMDFDIDLALSKSNENPVYYVQYAHARLCSILRNAGDFEEPTDYGLLVHEKELALLKQINEFTKVINDAALSRQPHKICNYMTKLASLFHSFYGDCKVITDDKDLQNQRLALVKATQIVIKNALMLVGVTAVERM